MDKDDKIERLERIVSQMMRPLKGIPFDVVVRALSGQKLIEFDQNDERDIELLDSLQQAIRVCCERLKVDGIVSRRANEVGNMMERPVIDTINTENLKLRAQTPTTRSGKAKSTGYPDILIMDRYDRPTYLEIKTFNRRNIDTTQRSFYLSPSDGFKVICDARHLALAFEMKDSGITQVRGENMRLYKPVSYKLIALDDLTVDVKHEFNSDNRRLYARGRVLLDEQVW